MSNGLKRFATSEFSSVKRGTNQYEDIARERTYFASALAAPIYAAFAAANYWVNNAPMMAIASVVAAILAMSALVLIRHCESASPGGHCFTLALASQVFGEMVFNGGLQAPAAALSPLVVPAAIFTAGAGAVRPWAFITVASLLAICTLDMTGFLPPNELPAHAQQFDRIFSLAAGILVSAALVIQYERQATRAIEKLVEQRASFRHRALHDSLTGLPNRSQFYEHGEQSLENANQNHTDRVIIYCDIDQFKQINDQHGHAIGDALLKAFASRLMSKVRPGDLAARLAGDEFAMIAETSSGEVSVDNLTKRLKTITDEPFELDGLILNVNMSIGIACFPSDGNNLDTLLRVADTQMYTAKSKQRSAISDPDLENVVPMPVRAAGNSAE